MYNDLVRIKELGVLENLQQADTLAILSIYFRKNNFETYINCFTNLISKFEAIKTYYDTPLNNSISELFGSIRTKQFTKSFCCD